MRIWPTSRGWFIAFSSFAWFGVALVNHGIFPFLLACGTVALLLVSFFCAFLSLRRFRIERAASGDAATGQMVSLPLRIVNLSGRRRQPVVLLETIPFATETELRTLVQPLTSRENRLINRQVLALHRGEFPLNRITMISGDPAGLFQRRRHFSCPNNIIVYPGTETVPDLLLNQRESMSSMTASPISAAGVSQDFYGVREYTPIDGLRFIHWKSSARYGRLMVKEFERNNVMSVAVLLDANERFVSGNDHLSNLEFIIRAAASICENCTGLYCDFAFASGGNKHIMIPPRAATEIRQDVFYALATLKPGRITLDEIAFEVGRMLQSKTVVFVFSLAATTETRDTLTILAEQGLEIRWYCADKDSFIPEKLQKRKKKKPVDNSQEFTNLLFPLTKMRPDMCMEEALSTNE